MVYIFASLLILSALIDMKTKTIPPYISILIIILNVFLNKNFNFLDSVKGLLFTGLILLIPTVICKSLFGGGDIKLVAACGFVLGLSGGMCGLFVALCLSVIPLFIQKIRGKTNIAFAPFIALGYVPIAFLIL